MLPKEQELAVIQATVQLKLKPFGPNKAFNMASLSAHLQNHAHIKLSADQIARYFASIIDLPFFELLLQRRQQRHSTATNNNTRQPINTPIKSPTGPATQQAPPNNPLQPTSRKRKSDEGMLEEDDDTVESGQEDVSVRRHQNQHHQQQPPSQKKRSNSHPPSTPTSSSSSATTSRSNTPRPSLRATRGNVNYKE